MHKGLKTVGVIYHSFLSMLQHLWEGGDPPSFVSYFASSMFTLGLWNDWCDTLHGANLAERQRMKRDKILDKLQTCYDQRDTIPECYRYIFWDSYETIGIKSTQYLVK